MNTVSLEVGKELFELGWRKECGFFYFKEKIYTSELFDRRETNGEYIEAQQLHEILEVLEIHHNLGVPTIGKCNSGDEYNAYFIHWRSVWEEHKFHHLLDNNTVPMCLSKNPHDAAAKLLIWCIKNNYVTI